jgi:hypothetical protein
MEVIVEWEGEMKFLEVWLDGFKIDLGGEGG